MPLSEESDPFARRHFAGSSGGETVPPWNGVSGTRARCPVRVDQVQPEPVPDGPGPDIPAVDPDPGPSKLPEGLVEGVTGPAPPRSAAETKKPERTANAARPGFSSAHGPPRSAPPPPRSAPGRTAPPTVTTCPICPAWVVSACPMSSGPPTRSPARAAPSSRTPPPP